LEKVNSYLTLAEPGNLHRLLDFLQFKVGLSHVVGETLDL